jgi:hypothetical protein
VSGKHFNELLLFITSTRFRSTWQENKQLLQCLSQDIGYANKLWAKVTEIVKWQHHIQCGDTCLLERQKRSVFSQQLMNYWTLPQSVVFHQAPFHKYCNNLNTDNCGNPMTHTNNQTRARACVCVCVCVCVRIRFFGYMIKTSWNGN